MRFFWQFLGDVLIVSIGAYGGPEAHYGVFINRLVDQKKYLSEDELYEYMALTSVIPGPSSTQTLMAVGYHVGGLKLAIATLIVWALPIVSVLTLGVYFYSQGMVPTSWITGLDALQYLAIGFVLYAASRLIKKGFKTPLLAGIGIVSFIITLVVRAAYIFPLVIIAGAFIHAAATHSLKKPQSLTLKYPWAYIALFSSGVIASVIGTQFFSGGFLIWSLFYQFGFLVIGGGQVVIPYMIETLVVERSLITLSDFLIGFGLVQGLPGPMFSFSAWAGGLSAETFGNFSPLGSLLAAFGLFLPGALLMLGIYPMWQTIKTWPFVKPALAGIIAVAAGLVLSTGIDLVLTQPLGVFESTLIGLTFIALWVKKIPAPVILLFGVLLSVLFSF